jgi:ribA/ribD-fused uncharacterized protein
MSQPQDARSVEQLLDAIRRGAHPKYIFFWGHAPKDPARIDQSCLSNWYPAGFTLDDVQYPTAEHYMMAEKARLFGDLAMREQILAADSPGEAKKLGRNVSGFDEQTWTRHRFDIVAAGGEAKFAQNENLGEYLRGTAGNVLVEASPHDCIWGIGLGRNTRRASHPDQWRGLNLLGFALMEARARLFGESQT